MPGSRNAQKESFIRTMTTNATTSLRCVANPSPPPVVPPLVPPWLPFSAPPALAAAPHPSVSPLPLYPPYPPGGTTKARPHLKSRLLSFLLRLPGPSSRSPTAVTCSGLSTRKRSSSRLPSSLRSPCPSFLASRLCHLPFVASY